MSLSFTSITQLFCLLSIIIDHLIWLFQRKFNVGKAKGFKFTVSVAVMITQIFISGFWMPQPLPSHKFHMKIPI